MLNRSLVDATVKAGALGARLTGAGFGGCMIALAHKDLIVNFADAVLTPYSIKFHRKPELIIASPDDGARVE